MIDINKKYRTYSGCEVRLYELFEDQERCLIGAMKYNGEWIPFRWYSNGKAYDASIELARDNDLIEVKNRQKRTIWLNVYPNIRDIAMHETKEDADRWCALDRIACVKIELDFEEGEGL